MSIPSRGHLFAVLTRQRVTIRSALARFEVFWRTQGRIASIETICEWVVRNSSLIDDFMLVQEQIHHFLVEGSEEEKNHIALTEDFERLYYQLMTEAQKCIDSYMFRKATRY